MPKVSETVTEAIQLLDADDPTRGLPGLAFVVDDSNDPAGAAWLTQAALDAGTVDLGEGNYTITFGPFARAGVWSATFHATDPDAQPFLGEWTVDPLTSGATTRGALRRLIALTVGDLLLATATQDGTTSQAISASAFAAEANHFAGREVRFTGGTAVNVGQTRTVRGSDPVSRSITLADPLPAPVAAGDTMELYNQRGLGWSVAMIDEAINSAIRLAGDMHATVPLVADAPTAFSRLDPTIPIPADFTHFEGLEYTDRRGARCALKPAQYRVDRFDRTVTVRGDMVDALNGLTPRLRGHRRPPLLTVDGDATDIPTDWIVSQVAALLLGGDVAAGYTTQGRSQLYAADTRAADGKRPITITRYGPNCVRLH